MQDQHRDLSSLTNSLNEVKNENRRSRKGVKRQWKDLPPDPLAEGFDEHTANYIVGKSSVTWADLAIGAIFSRSKSGKALHVKLDAGHGICLDTGEQIEIAPKHRPILQIWKVTSINTTTS